MANLRTHSTISELLLIGELSHHSQTPVKTIRYYEELGLLTAAQRTTGGFRQFKASCLGRLAFIKQAKSLGLSLQEIGHILAVHDQGERPCAEVRQTLQEKIEAIEQRIQELSTLKGHLQTLIAEADHSPDTEAIICPIIERSY
jgi:MerR family transcriptional regulator, copper efflux regulator